MTPSLATTHIDERARRTCSWRWHRMPWRPIPVIDDARYRLKSGGDDSIHLGVRALSRHIATCLTLRAEKPTNRMADLIAKSP